MQVQALNIGALLPWIIVVLVVLVILAIIWWLLNRAPLPPALYFSRRVPHTDLTVYNPRGSGQAFDRSDLTSTGGGPYPAYTIALQNPEGRENAPFTLKVSGLDADQLVDHLNHLRLHVSTRRAIDSATILGMTNLLARILGLFVGGRTDGPVTHMAAREPVVKRAADTGSLPAEEVSKILEIACAAVDAALASGLLLNQAQAEAIKAEITKSGDITVTNASLDRSLISTEIGVPSGKGEPASIVYYSFDPRLNAGQVRTYRPLNAASAWSQVYVTANKVRLTQWKWDPGNSTYNSRKVDRAATGYSTEIDDWASSSRVPASFGADVMGLLDASDYTMLGTFANRG